MKHIIPLLIISILLIFSCSSKKTEKGSTNKDIKVLESAIAIDSTSVKKGNSILDTIINGKTWKEIEITSAPDSALTLYAYRILFTDQKDEIHDCEIRINLLEETPKVKELMKAIFGHRLANRDINHLIDSLNLEGIEYARKQVERDIQKYGQSDGPCYELLKLRERK